MEIIVTHVSSDFDSFAGMIAANKIHPGAMIIIPSSINQNVRRFIALHEDALPTFFEPGEIDLKKVKKVIIIDTRIPSRLGQIKDIFKYRKPDVVIYDHHNKNAEDIKYGTDQSMMVGASTTILIETIRKQRIPVSPFEATLFSLGIYEDTGSFTYPNTTYRDLSAASFLKKKGASSSVLSTFLNIALTDDQHLLLERLITNMKRISINEKEVILSMVHSEDFIEGLSVLTRKLCQVEDVDVAICWVKMKEKIYIVARSDDTEVNVAKVIAVVGGGGHPQAASAVITGMDLEQIEKEIIRSLKENIKKPLLAKDIMSYPVRTVNENERIDSVNETLKKYGHSGIPIVNAKQNLVGIITRKDIDRAIKHGLSHAPVKGFRSHGVVISDENAPISELQKIMIDNAIGRIPILNKKEIIGIVTRKDILRFLHGNDYLKYVKNTRTRFDFDLTANEVKEKIYQLLPAKLTEILEIASKASRQLRINSYLVGGIVRDLLLGVSNYDIDIVIEGNGIRFAEKLAKLIPARVESHKKFNTAVLVLKSGQHIDIASARVEYYEKPAALPDIEPGNIRQDLARRDFTINTIAISLNHENFGEILDYFGGRKDIIEKKIKILHKMSFIEDPTRIFRAVRFEQRLGFKMDSLTEKLAGSTINMDLVSKLTGIRIRDEVIAILEEKKPWKALKRLFEMKALLKAGLNINIKDELTGFLGAALDSASSLNICGDPGYRQWRLMLICILLEKSAGFIKKWCCEMKIKKKDTEIIINSVSAFRGIKERLTKDFSCNSDIYALFHDRPYELLAAIGAQDKASYDTVMLYMTELKDIRPEINGNDLKDLSFKPSGDFRTVLESIKKLKIDGHLRSRQEELEMAKKILTGLKQK